MGKIHYFLFASSITVAILMTGCSFLLPSSKMTVRSPWKNFEHAKTTFDAIIPYKTTTEDLKTLKFDPLITPNIDLITYLDIIQRFMENPSIKKEDLAQGLQDCIAAKDECRAYEVMIKNVRRKRQGNVILDIFNFKRVRKETGWEFRALIVMKNDLVIYKLWGGKPVIDETVKRKNPLGPLQEAEDILTDLTTQGL